jgi:hypothetical protein
MHATRVKSKTGCWKIALFIRLARRKGKNKSRQTSTIPLGNSPDYVIRRFSAIFGRAEKPEGAEPSLELPLNAIFGSNWN